MPLYRIPRSKYEHHTSVVLIPGREGEATVWVGPVGRWAGGGGWCGGLGFKCQEGCQYLQGYIIFVPAVYVQYIDST